MDKKHSSWRSSLDKNIRNSCKCMSRFGEIDWQSNLYLHIGIVILQHHSWEHARISAAVASNSKPAMSIADSTICRDYWLLRATNPFSWEHGNCQTARCVIWFLRHLANDKVCPANISWLRLIEVVSSVEIIVPFPVNSIPCSCPPMAWVFVTSDPCFLPWSLLGERSNWNSHRLRDSVSPLWPAARGKTLTISKRRSSSGILDHLTITHHHSKSSPHQLQPSFQQYKPSLPLFIQHHEPPPWSIFYNQQ